MLLRNQNISEFPLKVSRIEKELYEEFFKAKEAEWFERSRNISLKQSSSWPYQVRQQEPLVKDRTQGRCLA
jgi:hypothetical protein